MNLHTVEIKAFVPARDFALSQRFYEALGFEKRFADDDLAYFCFGDCSFLLQRFFVPDHAHNFVMHLLVQDVDAWHGHVVQQDVAGRFGVKVGMPTNQPWAMRDFALHDPSGVLWLVAQNLPREGAASGNTP